MKDDVVKERFSLSGKWWLILVFIWLMMFWGVMKYMKIENPLPQSGKTVIALDTTGIYEIDFKDENGFYRITKELTEVWKMNDSLPINQESVANYIAQFDKITGKKYLSSFDLSSIQDTNIYSIIIKSADEPVDVEVKCYKVNHTEYKYLIHSNQQPDLFFGSDANGLKNQLFWKRDQFQ